MSEDRPPEHVSVYQRFRTLFGDGNARRCDGEEAGRQADGDHAVRRGARPARPRRRDRFAHAADGLGEPAGSRRPARPLGRSWSVRRRPAHAVPVGIEGGVLSVRCDLHSVGDAAAHDAHQGDHRDREAVPEAGIESVRLRRTQRPLNWKRGPRSIPGRGPRGYLRLRGQIWSTRTFEEPQTADFAFRTDRIVGSPSPAPPGVRRPG